MQSRLLGVIPVTLALAAAEPASADAQVLDLPRRATAPAFWGSAGIGWLGIGTIADGRTNTRWDFGGGPRLRASLGVPIGRSASLGLTGTWARMPLRYSSLDRQAFNPFDEDAHADVSSLLLSFHGGGGEGLHQVLSAGAGVVRFGRFTSDRTGSTLEPSSDLDFAFSIGYGFGYSLSPRAQIVLLQEYGLVLHQREGLANNASGAIQQSVTSLAVRYGLGARARR